MPTFKKGPLLGCFADKRDPGSRVSHFRVTLTAFAMVTVWRLPEFFKADPRWAVILTAVILFALPIRELFQSIPSAELLRALGSWFTPTKRTDDPFSFSFRDPPGGTGGTP